MEGSCDTQGEKKQEKKKTPLKDHFILRRQTNDITSFGKKKMDGPHSPLSRVIFLPDYHS